MSYRNTDWSGAPRMKQRDSITIGGEDICQTSSSVINFHDNQIKKHHLHPPRLCGELLVVEEKADVIGCFRRFTTGRGANQ